MKDKGTITPWLQLKGKIANEVLRAPKIGHNPKGGSARPEVNQKIVNYIERHVAHRPWGNHLALIALVQAAHQLDTSSIHGGVILLNKRFLKLFQEFRLETMEQWNADIHIPAYLRGEVVPEDSINERAAFSTVYKNAAKHVDRWFQGLTITDRQCYRKFIITVANPLLTQGIINWKDLIAKQRQNRKAETSAIVPLYPNLRAEAHYRYSKMSRLRKAFFDALKVVGDGDHELPFSFFYDEGGDHERGVPAQERLHFRLWDRRSLVLANPSNYGKSTIISAQKRIKQFATQHYYLEFIVAERLKGNAPPEGLWFEEILRIGVIGYGAKLGNNVVEKQKWLRSWGYGSGVTKGSMEPFRSDNAGILSWSSKETLFVHKIERCVKGVLIPIESLYASALFGLLATDIFTTTGARINETLQIRLDKDGLVRLEVPAPAGAKNQTAHIRYALKMIPKGERTNKLATYFIGRETERLIEQVAHMLAEHYNINVDIGETLPIVSFNVTNPRSHRFGPSRYIFQYQYRHFGANTINACLRFLLHGMVFMTPEGQPVTIKAHLLRHAFATHAVHVEKVPIDIVREILHQKDVRVTEYYSQPSEHIIADATDSLLARLASHINVKEVLLRSPQELKQQFDEAAQMVGPLGDVPGGYCTYGNICPGQRMCVGCPAKVPDPEKRDQIINKKRWAEQRIEYCIQEGLVMDAEKLRQTIRDCVAELKEMDMIEDFRRDETRVALIQIEPRRRK